MKLVEWQVVRLDINVNCPVLLVGNSVCCDAVLAQKENLLSGFQVPMCPQVSAQYGHA